MCVFVALSIKHAVRLRHIVICGLLALQFFPHYLINGTIFRKKGIEHEMCVLIFSIMFEAFLILRGTERDVIKIYVGLHVKYSFYLSDFNET